MKSEKELIVLNLPTIWNVKKGHGTFLTFDMGDKKQVWSPAKKEYVDKGTIHLWIYMCHWKITRENKLIASDELLLETEIRSLEGTEISVVERDRDKVRFLFSDSSELILHSDDDDDGTNDFFMLFKENEPTLLFNNSKGFYSANAEP